MRVQMWNEWHHITAVAYGFKWLNDGLVLWHCRWFYRSVRRMIPLLLAIWCIIGTSTVGFLTDGCSCHALPIATDVIQQSTAFDPKGTRRMKHKQFGSRIKGRGAALPCIWGFSNLICLRWWQIHWWISHGGHLVCHSDFYEGGIVFKGTMLFRFSTIHGSNDNPATAASSKHYYY